MVRNGFRKTLHSLRMLEPGGAGAPRSRAEVSGLRGLADPPRHAAGAQRGGAGNHPRPLKNGIGGGGFPLDFQISGSIFPLNKGRPEMELGAPHPPPPAAGGMPRRTDFWGRKGEPMSLYGCFRF